MIHMGVGELLFWWILAIQSLLSSSVSKIHDVAEDKMSPSIITLTTSNDLLARKWLDQWPIGNGKFGALVGGSIEGDIIPLSMAGFYVIEGSVGPKHDSSFLYQQFDESRKELMNGNFQESQKKLSNLISKTPLGMFQYISDISLLLSPSPLILQQPAILKVDKNAVGRKKLWITHKNLHKFPKNNGNYNFGNLNSSHVTLDTKIGISKSSFRVVNHSEKSVRLYSRVWFASSIDDVIVGKLQCRSENINDIRNIDEFNNSINNCLHLSLRFSRYINKREDLMPESKYIIQRYNSNSLTNTDIMFGNLKIPKNNIVSFELNLTPTPKSHHKDVVLCGVVICIPSFNSGDIYPSL